MKLNIIYIILFFLFLHANITMANGGGISGGGGGKGALCGEKVYSLDLWEARQNSILPVPLKKSFKKSLQDKLTRLLIHLNPPSYGVTSREGAMMDTEKELVTQLLENSEFRNKIKERIIDIPKGKRLPITKDATLPKNLLSNESIDQKGCKEIQILIIRKVWKDSSRQRLLGSLATH